MERQGMAHLLEALWTRLGGPADQGPVDLATLTRRSVPNDSVAASPGATSARVDVALPVCAQQYGIPYRSAPQRGTGSGGC